MKQHAPFQRKCCSLQCRLKVDSYNGLPSLPTPSIFVLRISNRLSFIQIYLFKWQSNKKILLTNVLLGFFSAIFIMSIYIFILPLQHRSQMQFEVAGFYVIHKETFQFPIQLISGMLNEGLVNQIYKENKWNCKCIFCQKNQHRCVTSITQRLSNHPSFTVGASLQ